MPRARAHALAPPLRQAVFDLETWGLDRGWGVTMVGAVLVHDGASPEIQTFDLRISSKWPDTRSDDSELGAALLKILYSCDVLYAHNGLNFDIPWLNSVALKFGMPGLVGKKLVDPVQVARRKYRIGQNGLAALAAFLGLEEEKMPVPAETWRRALLDNDQDSWETLRLRCESDVRLLNSVSAHVTRDVGMIDDRGSAWR